LHDAVELTSDKKALFLLHMHPFPPPSRSWTDQGYTKSSKAFSVHKSDYPSKDIHQTAKQEIEEKRSIWSATIKFPDHETCKQR
jgi:hypothetical protein